MEMKNVLFLMLGLAMAATSSTAVVYKVGDSAGWTIIGNVNYTDWSSTKTFQVGDTIVFQYPQGIHNVLEVTKKDYDTCTASSPIATHTSGNDKIDIKSPGHRFFICGVVGHCSAGQRVNIRVLKHRSSDAPSTAPSEAPSTVPAASAPSADGDLSNATTPAVTDNSTAAAPAPNASGAGIAACPVVAGMALITMLASLAILQ